ncbi:MAG: purine-nucleoside phosphorylase [Gammaproteobacteria bacterium]|nr:purine-nucleoside phosphorylase [Gammaproteobacteria bacterium]
MSFEHTLQLIKEKMAGFTPEIGLILGSGLGMLGEHIENKIELSYQNLPGFPVSTVSGHSGKLILGHFAGKPVACLQGRVHSYEGVSPQGVKTLIRTLKHLGCHTLVITNTSGSLRPEVGPGSLCLITDHINFQPGNPLVGPNEDEFGPRFFPLDNAYDLALREQLKKTATRLQLPLAEGVYFGTLGPCFETPAEIRAFRILGGDLVGMSTVPEVLVARHCGLRVAAIAAITNLAAGLSTEAITHENTLYYGQKASANMLKLVHGFIEDLT